MYVNAVSRYLGDANGSPVPSAARLAELSKSCATQWKAYKKSKGKNFPHVWRAFLAANPICREGVAIRWGYQPALAPCGDANTGLLIDCWDAALQKGVNLNGLGALGISLTQAQLTRASRHYASLPHAQQKLLRNPTGYVFNGTRMVRNRTPGLGRLGQDDIDDLDIPTTFGPGSPVYSNEGSDYSLSPLSPIYGPFPGQNGVATVAQNQALINAVNAVGASFPSAPSSTTSPIESLTASVASLLKAATGGGGQQTGQLPQQQARTPLQTSTLIPGVPNIILYGGAAFLLLIAIMGGRRR